MTRINTAGYLLVALFLTGSLCMRPAYAAGDASGNDGYEGVVAPTDDGTPKSAPSYSPDASTTNQTTPGYPGLTSSGPKPDEKDGLTIGESPKSTPSSAPQSTPQSTSQSTQQFTPAPSSQFTQGPANNAVIHDLGMASAVYAPQPGLQAPPADFSAVRHHMINGKPALVYVVEQRIKQAKDSINDKSLSRSERDQKGKEAYKSLSMLADGLRMRQSMPDSMYKSMKFSDNYIKEERDNGAAALTELDAALQDLKSYQ